MEEGEVGFSEVAGGNETMMGVGSVRIMAAELVLKGTDRNNRDQGLANGIL